MRGERFESAYLERLVSCLLIHLLFLIFGYRFVHSKNRANLGFTLGINILADKTPTELRALRGRRYSPGYNGGKPFPYDISKEANSIPENFDWRIFGAVNPVKGISSHFIFIPVLTFNVIYLLTIMHSL